MFTADVLLQEQPARPALDACGLDPEVSRDQRIANDVHAAFQGSLGHTESRAAPLTSALAGDPAADDGSDPRRKDLTANPAPAVAPSPERVGRLRNAIEAGRAICYLDDVVGELIDAVPPSKPWQRQLLALLATAEREIQVLRMTIALNRNSKEIFAAGLLVHDTLANAHTAAIKGRAPLLMKGGMRFAHEVSKRIKSALEVICDVPENQPDSQ